MRYRGMFHTSLGVVEESCKRKSIHQHLNNASITGTLENLFGHVAPFARWTMPAVFFKEVATRHDVFDDVKLTSQFTVLIVKL